MSERRRDFFVATLNREKKEVEQVKKETVVNNENVNKQDYFVSPSGKHPNRISVIDNSRGNASQYDFVKGKNRVDISRIAVGEGK